MIWKFLTNLAKKAREVVQSHHVQTAVVTLIVRSRIVVKILAGSERSRPSLHSNKTGSLLRSIPSPLFTHPTPIPLFYRQR